MLPMRERNNRADRVHRTRSQSAEITSINGPKKNGNDVYTGLFFVTTNLTSKANNAFFCEKTLFYVVEKVSVYVIIILA